MNKCTVLIVDDNKRNIMICREILEDKGMLVVSAENGRSGLQMAATSKPKVILLDIMMPVMGGYEMLENLKADPEMNAIPVLMLTAKTGIDDIVKALHMGANDYLKKPFVDEELLARVKTLCRLKDMEDRLKNTITCLEHEAEILAHKAELGIQAGGLAHDINNILSVGQLVQLIPNMLNNPEEHEKIRKYVTTVSEAIELGTEISRGYTDYLKNIGQEKKVRTIPSLFQPLSMYNKQFTGQLIQNIPANIPGIHCKADQIKRIIINLFTNAVQAIEQSGNTDGVIEFKAWHTDNKVFFSAKDNGAGIAADVLPHIFEERFTTKKTGTGLGLFMVKKIVEAHEGTIEAGSQLGKGTTFILSFPAVTDEKN